MVKSTLAFCLIALSLCSAAEARVHRGHPKRRPRENKIFAANHESVTFENTVAEEMGAFRYFTQAEVDDAVISGRLVPLSGVNIDRRLPDNRRYALLSTVTFIKALSFKFHVQFDQLLTVDSAVRPATVQKRLLKWNRNAAPAYGERASTHERGTTVDISKHLTKAQQRWLVTQLLYYRALGHVLVIQERGCFHIFVRSDQ